MKQVYKRQSSTTEGFVEFHTRLTENIFTSNLSTDNAQSLAEKFRYWEYWLFADATGKIKLQLESVEALRNLCSLIPGIYDGVKGENGEFVIGVKFGQSDNYHSAFTKAFADLCDGRFSGITPAQLGYLFGHARVLAQYLRDLKDLSDKDRLSCLLEDNRWASEVGSALQILHKTGWRASSLAAPKDATERDAMLRQEQLPILAQLEMLLESLRHSLAASPLVFAEVLSAFRFHGLSVAGDDEALDRQIAAIRRQTRDAIGVHAPPMKKIITKTVDERLRCQYLKSRYKMPDDEIARLVFRDGTKISSVEEHLKLMRKTTWMKKMLSAPAQSMDEIHGFFATDLQMADIEDSITAFRNLIVDQKI